MFRKKNKDKNLEDISEKNSKDGEVMQKKEEKVESKIFSKDNDNTVKINTLSVEVEKMKAGIEAFGEVRKSFTERFDHLSEQIGEIRAMVLDRDKNIQEVELKSIKAADLVESVQPEKMMAEIQKQSAKIDALKANLDGNESIMSRVMEELKEAKKKIEFFRGVEEIVKLSEETKKELIEIKKVESKIEINTDKVETIYAEMRKKFQNIEIYDSQLQELKVTNDQFKKDIQFLKDKTMDLVTKEELEKIVQKVQRYIDALKELEKKSSMSKDIDNLKNLLDSLK